MKKIWMVVDGRIGTAHHNREGRIVDFRPASSTALNRRGEEFCVCAQKGVDAEPLRLPAEVVEKIEIRRDPERGMANFEIRLRAAFEGVSLKETVHQWEVVDAEAARAYEAREVATKVAAKAAIKQGSDEVMERIAALDLAAFLSWLGRQLSQSEAADIVRTPQQDQWGTLEFLIWQFGFQGGEELLRELNTEPYGTDYIKSAVRKAAARLRGPLLDHIEGEKKRRKEAYLRKNLPS